MTLQEERHVLVVYPHPDDEAFSVAVHYAYSTTWEFPLHMLV